MDLRGLPSYAHLPDTPVKGAKSAPGGHMRRWDCPFGCGKRFRLKGEMEIHIRTKHNLAAFDDEEEKT